MNETMMITFAWDGRQRVANTKPVHGDFENCFLVTMDDGYAAHFFTTAADPYKWYEQHLGCTALAQIVGRALEKHYG